MKRLMSLWGRGAKAEDQPKDETDEEKAARETAEKEEADRKAEEDRKAKEAAASDNEEEDEEEDDEATKAAAAAVPAKVRASIVRAERTRIHAIVDGGGRDRVETSLQLALGTNLTAKAALAIVAATAGQAAVTTVPAGGLLGLGREMATRHKPALGPAATPAGGPQTEVDKAASSILKHVSKATA